MLKGLILSRFSDANKVYKQQKIESIQMKTIHYYTIHNTQSINII